MRYTAVFFLLLNFLLAGCTLSSITDPIVSFTDPITSFITKSDSVVKDKVDVPELSKVSNRIISAKGRHIEDVSIVSVKEIKKDFNTREAYQECYTKKYDKNQNEASLITSFFNTSKDSHIASVEFCETKHRNKKETRLMHYLVKYEYEGNTYTYTTNKKPNSDDKLKVKVIVVPEAYKGKISN